jgi:outer membrane protein assembly factor BamB
MDQRIPLLAGCLLALSFAGLSCGDVGLKRRGDRAGLLLRWNTPAHNVAGWPGAPAITGNTVIFGAYQGLAAFNTESGALLWTANLLSPGWSSLATNVALGDGFACVADQLTVGCVDVATGRVLWTRTDSINPALSNGESAYSSRTWFYGGRDHKVYAVNPETGRVRWATDIAPGAGGPTRIWGISIRGDTVYATTVRWLTPNSVPLVGDLVALNRRTGAVIWTYTTPGERGGFQGRALLTDRLAIVNDNYYHALVAIDLQTGKEVWRTTKDESGFISAEATPVLVGDTVFAASADMQVYAVNAKTGAVLWRVIGDGNALGSVDVCPKVLIPLEWGGGHAFLVDRRSHESHAIDARFEKVSMSSRFTVIGDKVYAAGGGDVYAFRCT